MKPTSEKVQRVLTQARAELSSNTRAESLWRTIEQLASDELQRRQQPAPAKDVSSVPAELIEQWWAAATIKSGGIYSVMSNCQYIADKALAYGREQAQQWVPAVRKGSFSSPPSDTPLLVRLDDGRVVAAMWHAPERGEEAGRFSTCTHERANLLSPHVYDDGGFSEIEAIEYLVIKPEPPTC